MPNTTPTSSAGPFPAGAAVEFVRADVMRDVRRGDRGTVVESFAPYSGRNVQLEDGRTVNVPATMLATPADTTREDEAAVIVPWLEFSGTYREQLGQLIARYRDEARTLREQGARDEARTYSGVAEGLRIARRMLDAHDRAEFMG